jgi:hypothetical protein
MSTMHLFCYEAKQPNLKLKTWPEQLLGYLLLAFALPGYSNTTLDGAMTLNMMTLRIMTLSLTKTLH